MSPRSPIRLAFVVNNLDVGGLEKVVISLLANLDRERFEPHLVCLSGPGRLFEQVVLPTGASLVLEKQPTKVLGVSVDVRSLSALRRYFAARPIDIVHAHNAAPLIYAGLAARSLRRRPRVLYSEHNQIYSASAASKRKFRYYLALADSVVSVSHDLEGTLRREVGYRGDIRVIHNGIDGTRFRALDGAAVRAELGVTAEQVLVGTGVVLSKQKGIEYLIKAARRVLAEAPEVRFAVAGDGPLRAKLEAEAKQAALGDAFRFLGYRGDMPAFIAALDVYVLPSLWEGLPLALCEALAVGKPVVCTRVGGNAEVILDGQNGEVVPSANADALADAVLRMVRTPHVAAAYRERNRKRFEEHFSLQSMVTAHEELYEQVARPGSASAAWP